jgi:hypothetical protein
MILKKKAFMIWAVLVLFFTAVPATGFVAGEIFPVSPFRITMVSSRGPLSAWRCGAWAGVNWSPDYFSAEWAPWNGSGLGFQSLSFVPHLWWTGGNYYFYRGYVRNAWKYWRPVRRNAPEPVAVQDGHRRRGNASGSSVNGRRRPSENSAPTVHVPRARPRVRPRPANTRQPVMRPQRPPAPPRVRVRH